MIEHLKHLKIGYEVRSIHQFKFGVGGSLQMSGYVIDPNSEVDDAEPLTKATKEAVLGSQKEQEDLGENAEAEIETDEGEGEGEKEEGEEVEGAEAEGEGESEVPFSLNIYHCTDKEIEDLNKFNSMHKLCENIDDFECSYNLMVDDSNKMDEIDYTFNSLQTQWMTMIIISCSEKEMYDISSLSLMAKSKSARLDGYNEYLSLNQINYKYIFLWLAIGYLFLFFVYFLHLFLYRYFNISMQSLLIFYPFFQFVLCVFSNLYWNYSSIHG